MKIKYACGLLALSVLCVLIAPFPAQANADPLEWAKIENPGLRGNIVIQQSEVSEIAVGSRGNIYALDSENSKVYQSLNTGGTWQDFNNRCRCPLIG